MFLGLLKLAGEEEENKNVNKIVQISRKVKMVPIKQWKQAYIKYFLFFKLYL